MRVKRNPRLATVMGQLPFQRIWVPVTHKGIVTFSIPSYGNNVVRVIRVYIRLLLKIFLPVCAASTCHTATQFKQYCRIVRIAHTNVII